MSVIHLELNVLRKNYGNNPIVVIPRISAFETQLQGTTSDHVQIFNIELKAKMKSHCMPEQVNLEFRGRVVFNADSVLGTDSRMSMNSQVTKPGNIAEDSSIISAREHFKTSHGYFIHPQGSKELVGSLETEWKTTNQYLLKEHAWLRCTRRCMFALVPQLNNLLMKDDSPSRSHKQVGQAVLPIVACWQSNISSCDAEFLMATHIGKINLQDSTLRVKQLVNAVSEKVIRAGE
ncbi:hypothetical protein LguiB_018232 [Lonicera macranthoides]